MMMGYFIFGYLKVHFMLIKYTRVPFKIAHVTHVLPVPVHRQTDFTLKLVVILCLDDTISHRSKILTLVQQPG